VVLARRPAPPPLPPTPRPQPPAHQTVVETVRTSFQSGHVNAPHMADLTGATLARLQMLPADALFPLVEQGLAPGTRSMHRRAIVELSQAATPTYLQWPLHEFLVHYLTQRQRQLHWAPQTLFRYMANITGALAKLPLYTTSALPIDLRRLPEWQAAMRAAEQDAQKSQPHGQAAADAADVEAACEVTDVSTGMALKMMWSTCARVGCTTKLRRGDVLLRPDGAMDVTFRDGKGVAFRGPYTVPTRIPPHWYPALAAYLASIPRPSDLLFPVAPGTHPSDRNRAMLEALRCSRQELNMRAMRRGSLQTMARARVPLELLMVFSGHRNVETLKRYLDWGRLSSDLNNRGYEAARHLSSQL
jgi:integrase